MEPVPFGELEKLPAFDPAPEALPPFKLPPVTPSVPPPGAIGNLWEQVPAQLVVPRGIPTTCGCHLDVPPTQPPAPYVRGPAFRSSDAPPEPDPMLALSFGNRHQFERPTQVAMRALVEALKLSPHQVPWDLLPPGALAHHGGCGDRGPEENNVHWTNWAGTLLVDAVDDFFRNRPEAIQQVVEIIRCAEAHGQRVRVAGSSWSFSDAAVPGGARALAGILPRQQLWVPLPGNGAHSIDMKAFNHVLGATFPTIIDALAGFLGGKLPPGYGKVIPGALKGVLDPGPGGPKPGRPGLGGRKGLFHVEAGITIRELYTYLDFEGDGGKQDNRWALPTQGGSGGQRLAGALSTGTHGGDFHEIAMTDMVRAIHLVGPGGIQYWIEPRSARVTDDAKLLNALRDVRLIADDETFRAALVSMGSLGVIVAVVIEVVAQFGLHEDRFNSDWTQVRAQLPKWLADDETHFLGITVNPYKLGDKPNGCWVTRRRKLDQVPTQDTFKKQQSGSGFDISSILGLLENSPIAPDHAAALGDLIILAASPLVEGTITPIFRLLGLPYPPGLFSFLLGLVLPKVAQLLEDLKKGTVTVEQFVSSEILDRFPGLIPDFIQTLVGTLGQAPHSIDGVGYQIMDTYPYQARLALQAELGGTLKIYSLDMMFDLNTGLKFMDNLLLTGMEEFRKLRKLMMAGIFAIRFAPASKALLSMSRFSPTMSIEAYSLKSYKDSREILQRLERAALFAGGIVHWGQHQYELNENDVRVFYGQDRGKWRTVRSSLIRNWLALDPNHASPYPDDGCVFDSDFTVRCGLSPPLK